MAAGAAAEPGVQHVPATCADGDRGVAPGVRVLQGRQVARSTRVRPLDDVLDCARRTALRGTLRGHDVLLHPTGVLGPQGGARRVASVFLHQGSQPHLSQARTASVCAARTTDRRQAVEPQG